MIERLNLTMLTDFYEITMANGYFCSDMAEDTAYFDMFLGEFRIMEDMPLWRDWSRLLSI